MQEWVKILLPMLVAGIGLLVVGLYSEVRKLDAEVSSRELLEWRIEAVERKLNAGYCPAID